ncbi:MAG TPA: SRPBCC family protein [Micromonosporaceae bacterium]
MSELESGHGSTAEVTVSLIVGASAERVYAAFTAWETQGRWIPFTTVEVTEGDGGVGSTIEAVTAVGPATLRDVMTVEELDPPYLVRVLHTGKVLKGPGIMRFTAMDRGRTQMVWHEWFQLPGGIAGKAMLPLLWPTSKVSLQQALKRFARLVEAGELP